MKKCCKCDDRFGFLGADVSFDESNILILEIKSFAANQMLNGHTRHCIKDSSSQWDYYVAGHNNKQYYIYNFNLPQYDNLSTIGITIEPGPKIRACHLKDDTSYSDRIKGLLKRWEKDYDIHTDLFAEALKPMSPEEVARRERSKIAEREIIKKGLTVEQIKRYVKEDGANINKENCIALQNAVEENDLEKAALILNLGGNPNLKSRNEAIINKAKNLDMIKLLVSNHAELTGEVFRTICGEYDVVEYCLEQGIDPNFDSSLPLRTCCRGSWMGREELGEVYLDVFKLLVKYKAKFTDSTGRNMAVKWAGEYGRIELIDYLIKDLGVDSGFKTSLAWTGHSRKLTDEKKMETLIYLYHKVKEYEPCPDDEIEAILAKSGFKNDQIKKVVNSKKPT